MRFISNLSPQAQKRAKQMPLAQFYHFKQNSLQEKCLILLSLILLMQLFTALYVHAYQLSFYLAIDFGGFLIFNHLSIKYKGDYLRLAFCKPAIFSISIMLWVKIFYFEMTRGSDLGIYLYYFPLMISIPFFYEHHQIKKYIMVLVIMVLLVFYFTLHHRIDFLDQPMKVELQVKSIYYQLSFVSTLCFVFLFLYFIYRKENLFDAIYLEHQQIENQNSQLEKMNQGNFKTILKLAQQNAPHFMNEFTDTYPDFIDYLDENHNKLTPAELKLCAYMRLNFSTKDVASICDISIRTVQNTKYSIRKKFQIESNEDIYEYIQGI